MWDTSNPGLQHRNSQGPRSRVRFTTEVDGNRTRILRCRLVSPRVDGCQYVQVRMHVYAATNPAGVV